MPGQTRAVSVVVDRCAKCVTAAGAEYRTGILADTVDAGLFKTTALV